MNLRVARSVFAVAEVLGGRHLPQPAAPAAPAAPDDDDWARRNAKRRALIRAVKRKPEFQAALDRGEDGTCCGIEPDPDDSTVSKRDWELRTTVWRQTLRQNASMPSPLKNPIRSGETLKTYAFAAQRPIPLTVDASVGNTYAANWTYYGTSESVIGDMRPYPCALVRAAPCM